MMTNGSFIGKMVAVALFVLLYGCIQDYKLPSEVSDSYQSEVVIEGRILSGEESVFYVTRTIPLTSGSGSTTDIVTDAQVKIIGENGYESKLAENIEDGKYTIDAGILPSDTRYAVEVTVGNEVYRSDFQSLLETPEISDLSWIEEPDEIDILISTAGVEDSLKYYMWSYEEDWQFHVYKDINNFEEGLPIYSEKFYSDFVEGRENPYFMCFNHATSARC